MLPSPRWRRQGKGNGDLPVGTPRVGDGAQGGTDLQVVFLKGVGEQVSGGTTRESRPGYVEFLGHCVCEQNTLGVACTRPAPV